jgi:nucleoid-associated protein YgaU
MRSWESIDMSTTLVLTAGPSADRHAPRAVVHRAVAEVTYRRRRLVAGWVLATVLAFGAVVTHDVLAGSGGVPASAAASQPARVRTTVTAQPGDTLWSIAERHRGGVAITRYVDKLVDLNGGASIQAGQAVVLP